MARDHSLRPLFCLLLAAALCCAPATAARLQTDGRSPMSPTSDAAPLVRYELRFPDAARHLVDVTLHLEPPPGAPLDLMMATWTPGSYLVREFARNVEELCARTADGRPLPVEKSAKNRWRIDAAGIASGHGAVTVSYRLYARELTVRTNFVDRELALLNGAPTFLVPATADGPAPARYRVHLELPTGWARTATALEPVGDLPHTYGADDLDTLIDSPIYAGNGTLHRFEVDGIPHLLLDHPAQDETSPWDSARAARDVERIVRAQRDLWGSFPYDRYLFLNLIVEAGGGLEHENSTVLMTSRFKAATAEGWRDWLGLVSHELFHAWNVKRLRPEALGPFDYEREVYTRSLWVAEGLTSYYDDLLVHRAGLTGREDYLASLSKTIERLQTTPGRTVQSLEQASFDAWIKHYRRDEWTSSSSVSYYTKGAVVAFLLDARIRRATDGEKSLDDALRTAYARYAGERGFSRDEIRAVLAEVAGGDLSDFFARALESTEELDYGDALAWYGLRFADPDGTEQGEQGERDDEELEDETPGWLGIETRVDDGRLLVTEVPRETPAWTAGVNVDDEILGLDGFRIPPRELDDRLETVRPGDAGRLLVARRGRLTELAVTFGEKPAARWKLEVDPDATDAQKARLAAWLGGA